MSDYRELYISTWMYAGKTVNSSLIASVKLLNAAQLILGQCVTVSVNLIYITFQIPAVSDSWGYFPEWLPWHLKSTAVPAVL